eukprot:3293425-Alexandrium_andersonii.AAC.1
MKAFTRTAFTLVLSSGYSTWEDRPSMASVSEPGNFGKPRALRERLHANRQGQQKLCGASHDPRV